MSHRIKFFSAFDLAAGYTLKCATPILDSFNPSANYTDINDVIELDQIKKFIDSGVLLKEWSDEECEKKREIVKMFPATIAKFCQTIDNSNFLTHYNSLDWFYKCDFWNVLARYNVFERLDSSLIKKCQQQEHFSLEAILRCKKVVTTFGLVLAEIMRESNQTADILNSVFLRADESEDIFIPPEFTNDDIINVFERHIASENANMNICELLTRCRKIREKDVPDLLRYTAKKKYEALVKKILESDNVFSSSVSVGFIESDKPGEFNWNKEKHEWRFSISKNLFLENLNDSAKLLQMIILYFGQFDCFGCSLLPAFENESNSLLDYISSNHSTRDYHTNIAFGQKSRMFSLQLLVLSDFLREQGKSLEDIFKWFFAIYLPQAFQVKGILFEPPSLEISFMDKSTILGTRLERVLKSYNMLVVDGEINNELLTMSTKDIRFSEISSLVKNKYAYVKSNELRNEIFFLFSNQSLIFNLWKEEDVDFAKCPQIKQQQIQWLIDRGTFHLDDNGIVQPNKEKIFILRLLRMYEVLCLQRLPSDTIEVVQKLIDDNELEIEDTLLTRPECQYMNYILNNKGTENGFSLRNQYAHGSNAFDEKLCRSDYAEWLKVWLLVVAKINDDLCLYINQVQSSSQAAEDIQTKPK